MGIEDNVSRGSLFHKTTLKHKSTVFTIGNRGDILTTQLEAPVIVPHAAQKSATKVSADKSEYFMYLYFNFGTLFDCMIVMNKQATTKIFFFVLKEFYFIFLNFSTRTKHCFAVNNTHY